MRSVSAMLSPCPNFSRVVNKLRVESGSTDSKIKFLHLSSDDIRAEYVRERMQKFNETHDKAFGATQKTAKKAFDDRLAGLIDEILEDSEYQGFAVYLDKNILPNQFSGLEKQLSEFKQRLESDHVVVKVVGLIPHCEHPEEEWKEGDEEEEKDHYRAKHPFSYNYLLQTYMRTHLRKDHPTIIASDSHLKPISISCFFFNQFSRVEFANKDGKCI